jgi:hypothetical protein
MKTISIITEENVPVEDLFRGRYSAHKVVEDLFRGRYSAHKVEGCENTYALVRVGNKDKTMLYGTTDWKVYPSTVTTPGVDSNEVKVTC